MNFKICKKCCESKCTQIKISCLLFRDKLNWWITLSRRKEELCFLPLENGIGNFDDVKNKLSVNSQETSDSIEYYQSEGFTRFTISLPKEKRKANRLFSMINCDDVEMNNARFFNESSECPYRLEHNLYDWNAGKENDK